MDDLAVIKYLTFSRQLFFNTLIRNYSDKMDSSSSDTEKSTDQSGVMTDSSVLDQSGNHTDSSVAEREEGPERKRMKIDPDLNKSSDIETDPLAKLLESPDSSASEKNRSLQI